MIKFFKVISIFAMLAALAGCSSTPAAAPASTAFSAYKDGTYEVKCSVDGEGYFVKGTLTIQDGKITSAEWAIYDAGRQNKVFDKDYETVFAGNDTYIQQCRDNLKGMAGYSAKLVETQDADGVDAVSGATWAYHKFEQFVKEGLKQASGK